MLEQKQKVALFAVLLGGLQHNALSGMIILLIVSYERLGM